MTTKEIGDKFAAMHVSERFFQRGGAFIVGEAACGAENVAGGKMARAEALADQFGLGAFADAGRAEQHETKGSLLSARRHGTMGVVAFQPSCAVVFLAHNVFPVESPGTTLSDCTRCCRISAASSAFTQKPKNVFPLPKSAMSVDHAFGLVWQMTPQGVRVPRQQRRSKWDYFQRSQAQRTQRAR